MYRTVICNGSTRRTVECHCLRKCANESAKLRPPKTRRGTQRQKSFVYKSRANTSGSTSTPASCRAGTATCSTNGSCTSIAKNATQTPMSTYSNHPAPSICSRWCTIRTSNTYGRRKAVVIGTCSKSSTNAACRDALRRKSGSSKAAKTDYVYKIEEARTMSPGFLFLLFR